MLICPLCKKQEGLLAEQRERIAALEARVKELEELIRADKYDGSALAQMYLEQSKDIKSSPDYKTLEAKLAAQAEAMAQAGEIIHDYQVRYNHLMPGTNSLGELQEARRVLALALSSTPSPASMRDEARAEAFDEAAAWHDKIDGQMGGKPLGSHRMCKEHFQRMAKSLRGRAGEGGA